MEGMEKIGRAILDKVKADAEQIVKEAEQKAWQELEKAEKQRETKFKEEKRKIIEEAERQASRILAQSSIKARQEVSRAKTEIIDGIVSRVRNTLPAISSDEGSLLNLIKEAVEELGADEVRVYVSRKNISAVRKLVKEDKGLASKIMEIKEFDCAGGVIAENIDGKVSIDNTYETRLEMLLPQIVPEISRELFGNS
jgi:vacuolar-type H+-ATPase subunit E/Vma4